MSRESRFALLFLVILLILAVALYRAQGQDGGLPDPEAAGFPSEMLGTETEFFSEHQQFAQIIYAPPPYPERGDDDPIPLSRTDAADYFIPEEIVLKSHFDADGEPLPPTGPRTTWCPDDQPACPQVQAPPGVTVTVNVYESPEGHGYEVVYSYRDATGHVWRRVDNVGPETYRDTGGWLFVSPLATPGAP